MKRGAASALQPDWWSKSLAGGLLGLFLALALCGLFAWAGPGGIDALDKVQFVMWSVPPVWMTVFAFSYLFATGTRAWAWLGGANALAWAALVAARSALGG